MPALAEAEVFNQPLYQFETPEEFVGLDIASMSEEAAERIKGVAVLTPVLNSQALSSEYATVVIKDETQQLGRCFKPRGALNTVAAYNEAGLTDFETASGGSFAIGARIAISRYGGSLEAVVPEGTSPCRQTAIRSQGVELIEYGENFDAAYRLAKERSEEYGRTFLHPFANPRTIAGQGTIGLELADQVPDMTHLVLPIGGGSLLSGVASVIRKRLPDVQIVAAQVERCTAYVDSLKTGSPQRATDVDTRFSGLAVCQTHPLTLALGSQLVDQVVVVGSHYAYETIDLYRRHEHTLLEESGVVGPAAARYLASLAVNEGSKIVTVATGGNPSSVLEGYAAAVARRRADQR